jgi:hypothetical protein
MKRRQSEGRLAAGRIMAIAENLRSSAGEGRLALNILAALLDLGH